MLVFNRKSLVYFARLLLVMMFFAQYSLAARACVMTEPAPAMAFISKVMPDCHMNNNEMAAYNPNACFTHCMANYQILDSHPTMSDFAVVLSLTPLLTVIQPTLLADITYQPDLIIHATGPPTYLLNQNFRI